MAEIDRKWARSAYNNAGEEEYGARNLHRHREAIAALFGIEIVCDRTTSASSTRNISAKTTLPFVSSIKID